MVVRHMHIRTRSLGAVRSRAKIVVRGVVVEVWVCHA